MFNLTRKWYVVGLLVAASTLFWTSRMTQPLISVVQQEAESRTFLSYPPAGTLEDVKEITPGKYCPPWPDQNSDQKTIQLLRKQNVEKECQRIFLTSKSNATTLEQLAISGIFRPNLQNILVDDKHEALYCYIPKVACTNWKKMMLILTGEADNDLENISRLKTHYGKELKKLVPSTFSKQEILQRLKSYRKFLIVRHPLERLLSAYKNKFVEKTKDAATFKKIYAVKMMMYTRNKESSPGSYHHSNRSVPSSGEGMKFEEFLDFLTSRPKKQFQEHWASYFDLCHPCTINYDFIGLYETLETDSNGILKMIGAPSELKFPSYKPSNTSKEIHSMLERLPSEFIEAMYKSYSADYRIFNYTKLPYKC